MPGNLVTSEDIKINNFKKNKHFLKDTNKWDKSLGLTNTFALGFALLEMLF